MTSSPASAHVVSCLSSLEASLDHQEQHLLGLDHSPTPLCAHDVIPAQLQALQLSVRGLLASVAVETTPSEGKAQRNEMLSHVATQMIEVAGNVAVGFPSVVLGLSVMAASLVEAAEGHVEESAARGFVNLLHGLVRSAYEFAVESSEESGSGSGAPHSHSHSHGNHSHSHVDHGHHHGNAGGGIGQEAFQVLGRLASPAAWFLGNSSARSQASIASKPGMLEKMEQLRWAGGGIAALHRLLAMLHEESLLVIHPEEKKGFVVRISGVAENYQLHTLLMDSLCRLGETERLQGTPVEARFVEVMSVAGKKPQRAGEPITGHWELGHWTAAILENSPANTNKRVVRGDGVPGDVSRFRGQRVLVLEKPLKKRQWGCSRTFSNIGAQVSVERVLSLEEVEGQLASFRSATAAEKKAGIDDALLAVNMISDGKQ